MKKNTSNTSGGNVKLNEKDQKLFLEFLKEQTKQRKEAIRDRQIENDLSKTLLEEEKDILKIAQQRKEAVKEYNDYARTMSELLKGYKL